MIYVKISGVEYYVSDLRISDVINSQPNTAEFVLHDPSAVPQPGQVVSIYRDTTANILFGGVIVGILEETIAPSKIGYKISCLDYQRILGRLLVSKVYENKTCKEIIVDMVTNYTDSGFTFTTANVQDGIKLVKIVFNYKPLDECIKELADLTKFNWYVDDVLDIHFFADDTTVAPLEINDTTLKTDINSFQVSPDYSQVRNRIIVRGGYYLSDPYTETQVATADQKVFKLGYKPHVLSMTVNAAVKTIGIEFLNDETAYDYVMNYQESTVRCSSVTAAPGDGAVMAFTYDYETPVIVRVNNYASQAAIAALEGGTGIIEQYVVDETLTSKSEAYSRANAELSQFSDAWVSGSFITFYHGFKSGQTLTLNITGGSYNGNYQIDKVNIIGLGNNVLEYVVSFSTTVYDLVEYLIGLAREQKNVKVRDDEIVDLLEYIDETVTITENSIATLSTHPAKWGTFKWARGTWGA
jgi:hypothetical protein